MNVKWSALVLGASMAMTAVMPAIPALAASHHGVDHGGHGNHGQHGRYTHDNNHGSHGQNKNGHGPQGKDRLKVMKSEGEVTAPEAALLASLTLSQGTASSLFAQGTPFTVYTVRIVGPHARWSGTGNITVSDNNGSLTTPADLYYMGFQRGWAHPDPFQGDTTPLNASTVGQSSNFSVRFVRGQAQFAVFDGQAGSGPIQITLQDQALNQSKTVTYPDVATTKSTATATDVVVVGSPTVSLAPGQSATVEFQVTGQSGQPVTQSGQTVDLSLAGVGSTTIPTGVTLNGGEPTVSSPLVLQTGANGTVSATLTNVSDTTGATYTVDAVLAGSTTATPAQITVTDISTQGAVSALGLSSTAVTTGSVTPLAIPATITVPVGTTLNAAELGAAVNAPIYIEGINASGDAANGLGTTGDTLMVQTADPSVVSFSGWNAQSEAVLASGVTTIPVITAEATGTATVTIEDVTNPAASSIVLTIDVVAAQPVAP